MPFAATWMQLEIVVQGEVSQKEKQVSCGNICMWSLKYNTNERTCGTETGSLDVREQPYGCQGGRGVAEGWSGRLALADVNQYMQNE